jgi:polysaccharide deacetylase family protein (PEP-CTERM system associated)
MNHNEPIVNAMSVDVEDYFQVSAFEKCISRHDWESLPCRVERNTDRVLAMFDEAGVKATFFTLGWVAERYPDLVKRIASGGHEIASHGFSHVRATEQSREEFREDIRRTRTLLQDISGQEVTGYRAASFSISARNLWALDELAAAGHRYSSSVNPIHHDLYGIPDAPRFAFKPGSGDMVEVPITTVRMGGKNIPCGGGGYFRLLPYMWFKYAIGRVNRREDEPVVFYFHPWEIDPDQPRQHNVGFKTRLRHYTNLSRMEARLKRLMSEFSWGRMDTVFANRPSYNLVDLEMLVGANP